MRTSRHLVPSLILFTLLCGSPASAADEPFVLHDPLPDSVQARIAARDALLARVLPPPADLQFFADRTKTWDPGSVVRVAFRGGDPTLRQLIAEVAAEWQEHAHLQLDFGQAPDYRSWSPDDTEYQAEIRVTFTGKGYHSAVGTDATDPLIFEPGESSMTLGGFDHGLPTTWKATTRHEFGHALGLLHEHQQPNDPCREKFRWDDDPGYQPTYDERGRATANPSGRPGIYRILGGPPWHWSKARIDHNLKAKPASDAFFEVGDFDPASIMRYWFPPWMFREGAAVLCTPSSRNLVLSDGDKAGIAKLYPRGPSLIRRLLDQRHRYYKLLTASDDLPVHLKEVYGERLRRIIEARDALAQ